MKSGINGLIAILVLISINFLSVNDIAIADCPDGGLDWETPAPRVTMKHWKTARQITEYWRKSAHRLVEQIDRSGDARREQSIQSND